MFLQAFGAIDGARVVKVHHALKHAHLQRSVHQVKYNSKLLLGIIC